MHTSVTVVITITAKMNIEQIVMELSKASSQVRKSKANRMFKEKPADSSSEAWVVLFKPPLLVLFEWSSPYSFSKDKFIFCSIINE